MAIGILWAMFAPALIFLLIFILNLITKKLKLFEKRGYDTKSRIPILTLLVVLPIAIRYIPDRIIYEMACIERQVPKIFKTVKVDGFFLDSSTANSFGTKYINDEGGFKWMEIRSIYNRTGFTRYDKTEDGFKTTEIEKITAKFTLKDEHTTGKVYNENVQTIINNSTGEVLAKAHSLYYNGGGFAKWFLGSYGSSSCPSALTRSEDFKKNYWLGKYTLGKERNKK